MSGRDRYVSDDSILIAIPGRVVWMFLTAIPGRYIYFKKSWQRSLRLPCTVALARRQENARAIENKESAVNKISIQYKELSSHHPKNSSAARDLVPFWIFPFRQRDCGPRPVVLMGFWRLVHRLGVGGPHRAHAELEPSQRSSPPVRDDNGTWRVLSDIKSDTKRFLCPQIY
jgi:hypothetical protein